MKGYSLRNESTPEALIALSAYPEVVRKLLTARGMHTPKDAEAFLNPDYTKDVYDPFLLLGMREAISRIVVALQKKEHIAFLVISMQTAFLPPSLCRMR